MNPSPFSLSGKTILVSGASSGIGQAIAIAIAQQGGEPILTGRDENKLNITAAQIQSCTGVKPKCTPFDLHETEKIPQWMKQNATKWGILSGFVHSAGIHETRPIRGLSSEAFARILNLNVIAGSMLLKGFRQKDVSNGGSIVLIASAAAIKGEPAIHAYTASKGAILALTRSAAIELAKENIRVNCIAPSVVRTAMADELELNLDQDQFANIIAKHPLGIGSPNDIALATIFLLSNAAKWITGITLPVDGGYTAQ